MMVGKGRNNGYLKFLASLLYNFLSSSVFSSLCFPFKSCVLLSLYPKKTYTFLTRSSSLLCSSYCTGENHYCIPSFQFVINSHHQFTTHCCSFCKWLHYMHYFSFISFQIIQTYHNNSHACWWHYTQNWNDGDFSDNYPHHHDHITIIVTTTTATVTMNTIVYVWSSARRYSTSLWTLIIMFCKSN